MRTLVVDDEMVSRKKMMKIIADYGQCEGVKTGKAAISAIKQSLDEARPYKLITLDISMPDIDGTEVLNVIRKLEDENDVSDEEKSRVLMVTSHSDIETVKACAGKCDGYVVKPFNKEIMEDKLNKIGVL